MAERNITSPAVQDRSGPSLTLSVLVRHRQMQPSLSWGTLLYRSRAVTHRSTTVYKTVTLIRGYIFSHVLQVVKARVTGDRQQGKWVLEL